MVIVNRVNINAWEGEASGGADHLVATLVLPASSEAIPLKAFFLVRAKQENCRGIRRLCGLASPPLDLLLD